MVAVDTKQCFVAVCEHHPQEWSLQLSDVAISEDVAYRPQRNVEYQQLQPWPVAIKPRKKISLNDSVGRESLKKKKDCTLFKSRGPD